MSWQAFALQLYEPCLLTLYADEPYLGLGMFGSDHPDTDGTWFDHEHGDEHEPKLYGHGGGQL
jgi:hypothetical protein